MVEKGLYEAREFVCQLIAVVYKDLRLMIRDPGLWRHSPTLSPLKDWENSDMRQIYLCVYPAGAGVSVFESLIEKYGLELKPEVLFERLDPMYRQALSRVNEYRESHGYVPYPEVETAESPFSA